MTTMSNINSPLRTEAELAFIRQMLDALDPFFKIRTAMPARCIQAFLLVAEKEGLSVIEYAKRGSLNPTTMSRDLLDLGDRDRKGDEGAGLVRGYDNLMDRRQKAYELTSKGRALLAAITRRVK
jgi:DNA-binding MarR family transcriptional regulator